MRKNTRKLIGQKTLASLAYWRHKGVPLAKQIRDNALDISGPHLTKLLDYFDLIGDATTIQINAQQTISDSLFPPWIEGFTIRQQPNNWSYIGKFPFGKWKSIDKYNEDLERLSSAQRAEENR